MLQNLIKRFCKHMPFLSRKAHTKSSSLSRIMIACYYNKKLLRIELLVSQLIERPDLL